MKKTVLSLAIIGLVSAGIYFTYTRRQPSWIAIDRLAWDEALRKTNAGLSSVEQVSAERTNAIAASALAEAINYSKIRVLSSGTKPIPTSIRTALEQHFPVKVLDEVRWSLSGERIELGSALTGWYFNEGAVTLDNVIVFADDTTAKDLGLWAHELTHAVQYRELGVADFARLYVTDWPIIEQQARRNGRAIIKATGTPGSSAKAAERPSL